MKFNFDMSKENEAFSEDQNKMHYVVKFDTVVMWNFP